MDMVLKDQTSSQCTDLIHFLQSEKVEFNHISAFYTTDFVMAKPQIVIYPKSEGELKQIMGALYNLNLPYHVVSQGQNFGYGDQNLNQFIDILIHLQNLNKILNYNSKLGTVEVEPGVTQEDLYQFLKQSNEKTECAWCLDVTGATKKASLVGNYLERGFGHSSFGDHESTGKIMKGIAPNGEEVVPHQSFVNFSHVRGLYQHDLGLNFEKIFYQTNFMVVTRYLVRLRVKPERTEFAIVLLRDEESAGLALELVSQLKIKGDIQSVPHMANSNRASKTQDASHLKFRWILTIDISGSRQTVASRRKILKKTFSKYDIMFFNDLKIRALQAMVFLISKQLASQIKNLQLLQNIYKGIPQDDFVVSAFGELNKVTKKAMWICPLLPAQKVDFLKIYEVIRESILKQNKHAAVTVSLIGDRCAAWVTEIVSDQSSGDCQSAIDLYVQVESQLKSLGYPFYRYGLRAGEVVHTSKIAKAEGFPLLFELAQKVKQHFDPKDLLSRGRWGFK